MRFERTSAPRHPSGYSGCACIRWVVGAGSRRCVGLTWRRSISRSGLVTDDAERLEGYSGYERATELFNDQLGTEDKEAWREHAPQEPHPSIEDEQ